MRFRIENLPKHTTEHDMRQLFSGFGKVLSAMLLPGQLRSRHVATGVIEFESIGNPDTGGLPDRFLFRGAVLRITQDPAASENRTPESTAAAEEPDRSEIGRPGNRSKNTLSVTSVEELFDPTTGKPSGWCRYSIQSLAGSVTGLRRGSVAETTLYAEEAAEAFNRRNMLGHQRPTNWSSRSEK